MGDPVPLGPPRTPTIKLPWPKQQGTPSAGAAVGAVLRQPDDQVVENEFQQVPASLLPEGLKHKAWTPPPIQLPQVLPPGPEGPSLFGVVPPPELLGGTTHILAGL